MLSAPFTDEQLWTIISLEQHYEVWSEADRALSLLPYGFKWKSVNGREYLYEMHDRKGNGKSHGRRSEETEHLYRNYRARKEELAERRNRSSAMLNQTCRLYRALRLPLLSAEAARRVAEVRPECRSNASCTAKPSRLAAPRRIRTGPWSEGVSVTWRAKASRSVRTPRSRRNSASGNKRCRGTPSPSPAGS